MHEIKIYGEVVPFEDAWIMEEGGLTNLTSVQSQLKDAGGKDIRVRINSCGGDVDTGFAIYSELRRYAKDNSAKIETFGEARVASIATVIFLAGDKRILTEHTEPFIHNAWCYSEGDSKSIMRTAIDLEKCNKKIAEHYALHTDLSVEEALELMENETSITTNEAKEMRFATDIEQTFRPAALKRFNKSNKFNFNNPNMNKNKKTKSVLAKLETFFKSIAGAENKVVYTADDKELDFYELEEDEIIDVGANATIDGEPAKGEYVMTDGKTFVFNDSGVLTEIKEKQEETSEEAVALQAEIDNLTEKLESITNKAIELETLNKAQAVIINNARKTTSKEAPNADKQNAKETQKNTVSEASKAVANINKYKQKK